MKDLENSTLELLHRRRIRAGTPGWVLLGLIVACLGSMPLIYVDVVSTSRGMVRNVTEPARLISPRTGIVKHCLLRDNLEVIEGDTLLWFRKEEFISCLASYQRLMKENRSRINDLHSILEGDHTLKTDAYRQGLMMHLASLKQLRVKEEYCRKEYKAMETLLREELVPKLDFEKARSEYRMIRAEAEQLNQSYMDRLSSERTRLKQENLVYAMEIQKLRAGLGTFSLIAPSSGTLMNCQGIKTGSVVSAGDELATVSCLEELVAECYLSPGDIGEVLPGMKVRIFFDSKGGSEARKLETEVSLVDPDVMLVNGSPCFRVKCRLGRQPDLRQGMTFSASLILDSRSLASILIDKGGQKFNPFRKNANHQ